MKKVITRIAPSPTAPTGGIGLHLGTIRCFYHAWLAAKSTGGTFILRIDDTDIVRSRQEMIDPFYKFAEDFDLPYDETFKQSDRFDVYLERAKQLIADGHAAYDNGCVRLKTDVSCDWTDELTGDKIAKKDEIEFACNQVIIKSDGSPVYNFATVVDDIDYNVNHIIRGVDHISNTFKQAALYRLFGQELPKFSHVGLVCHTTGKKLSKRDSDGLDLSSYNKDAVLNYVLRLGWAPFEDTKKNNIITKDRAIDMFFAEGKMRPANSKIDMNKLKWYDKVYTKMSK